MTYLTPAQIAEKWGISDRRVRILCKEGRIEGVYTVNGRFMIPSDAVRPHDNRFSCGNFGCPALWIKWDDEVIGEIDGNYQTRFIKPCFNKTVETYTHGQSSWDRSELESFLSDRLVSRNRRDIEHILFRLGFSRYDIFRLAYVTHAINASDLLWITDNPDQHFSDAVTEVFGSVFGLKKDLEGDSVDSPEGMNIKRYGVYNGHYGIYKKRIHPLSGDIDSEVAVYKIAELLGVKCCPAYRIDENTVFSQFEYDFAKEYIIHFRRFFNDVRGENEYLNLLSARPQYQADIVRMIALDFITRQDDRHLSNIAVKISGDKESFYPLYDNGRSLFYEDTEETMKRAISDIKGFSTGFGPVGSYYDCIEDIKASGIDFARLLNLNISYPDIKKALTESGFSGIRLKASAEWIQKTIEFISSQH